MKNQDIIIEIAKLDGIDTSLWADIDDDQTFAISINAKHYLTSRDAIIPVIERVIGNDSELEMKFNYCLYDQLEPIVARQRGMTFIMAVRATPRQLCIALLKATGRWKE